MKTKENSSREIVPGHNAIWIRLTYYRNTPNTKIKLKPK